MLRLLGHPTSACDGLTRRDLLRAGALTALAGLAPAASAAPSRGRAKAVLLIDLFGWPSHLDSFDPKPAAPPEVRGEFGTIATALPGVRVAEYLPRLARRLSAACLIRTLSHRYNSHNPYAVMTGYDGGNDRENYFAKPSDHPSLPSVCQYLGVGRRRDLPGYVMLPAFPGYSQGLRRAGPYGGYLGGALGPVFSTCEAKFDRPNVGDKDTYDHTLVPRGQPRLPSPSSGLTLDALDRRRSLLRQVDAQARQVAGTAGLSGRQQQAFDLLLSPRSRVAFDLEREPPAARDRYGRDLWGSTVLLARRLVEAGVPFVTVHTESKGNGHWDTHSNNFKMLRHFLLPTLDRAVAALLDDLRERGLLETTLVVCMGEFGRTPRINGQASRDHWPQCYFSLWAGGGVRPGRVVGESDGRGQAPITEAVTPAMVGTTLLEAVGVDSQARAELQVLPGGRVIHEFF